MLVRKSEVVAVMETKRKEVKLVEAGRGRKPASSTGGLSPPQPGGRSAVSSRSLATIRSSGAKGEGSTSAQAFVVAEDNWFTKVEAPGGTAEGVDPAEGSPGAPAVGPPESSPANVHAVVGKVSNDLQAGALAGASEVGRKAE